MALKTIAYGNFQVSCLEIDFVVYIHTGRIPGPCCVPRLPLYQATWLTHGRTLDCREVLPYFDLVIVFWLQVSAVYDDVMMFHPVWACFVVQCARGACTFFCAGWMPLMALKGKDR